MAYTPRSHSITTMRHMADDHIYYELSRVVEFATNGNVVPIAWRNDTPPEVRTSIESWVSACILESALVHLRNIAEFLVSERPTRKSFRTSIVADHYFEDGWKGRKTFVLGRNAREHKRLVAEIHRRVVHLSTQRASVQRKGPHEWNVYVREQFPPTLRAFRRFLDQLAEKHPRRAQWFVKCDAALRSAAF